MASLDCLRTMGVMRHIRSALVMMFATVMATVVVSQSACTQAAPAPAAAAPVTSPANPVGTVKEIMKGIVDPSSAAIWDAVGTESGPKGVVEKAPKTDEEWTKLEGHALMLAEVANLLKMPGRHVAKTEEANSKTAP